MDNSRYKSLLVIVIGFIILFWIFDWSGFLYIAGGVGILSLLSEKIASIILWLWYKIAEIFGWINTRIILTTIFYLFLFPISLMYRLFNKDALRLKRDSRTTLFFERNHKYTKKDLENIW